MNTAFHPREIPYIPELSAPLSLNVVNLNPVACSESGYLLFSIAYSFGIAVTKCKRNACIRPPLLDAIRSPPLCPNLVSAAACGLLADAAAAVPLYMIHFRGNL